MSRDESLERDAEMKDATLTVDRSEADLSSSGAFLERCSSSSRRCSSRSPSPSERMEVASSSSLLLPGSRTERYHRSRHTSSTEPTETVSVESPLPVIEQQRDRTRRYGSGGSSSSSGLSMDTGGTSRASATGTSSDVFARIRHLSEERVVVGASIGSSTGEDEEEEEEEDEEEVAEEEDDLEEDMEEKQVSDLESSRRLKSSASLAKISLSKKKKKSKLSGSSDSGVSDVSTNEPLPAIHDHLAQPTGSLLSSSSTNASSTLGASSSTPSSREAGGKSGTNSTVCGSSQTASSRQSRRVSRLSTDSSGDCKIHSQQPRIIPWEVDMSAFRSSKAATPAAAATATRNGPTDGSKPGTPLYDESDELPTGPPPK